MEPIKQIAETKVIIQRSRHNLCLQVKEETHPDNLLVPIVLGALATVILLVAVLVLVGFTLRRRSLERKPPGSGECWWRKEDYN